MLINPWVQVLPTFFKFIIFCVHQNGHQSDCFKCTFLSTSDNNVDYYRNAHSYICCFSSCSYSIPWFLRKAINVSFVLFHNTREAPKCRGTHSQHTTFGCVQRLFFCSGEGHGLRNVLRYLKATLLLAVSLVVQIKTRPNIAVLRSSVI